MYDGMIRIRILKLSARRINSIFLGGTSVATHDLEHHRSSRFRRM